MAGLNAGHAFDRFARWTPAACALGALLVVAISVWAVAANLGSGPQEPPAQADITPAGEPAEAVPGQGRDTDLQLYDAIAERVAAGEDYHAVAVEEQRARDFPVTPGLAVRLPTLAHLTAALGETGMGLAAVLLVIGLFVAWWRRLGEEPGGADRRPVALALLAVGTLMGAKPEYLALHEVWAGLFLALSLALHRPGRWIAAWLAAAAALAIREHALPFVLLLGALALWRRDWREFAAWALLVMAFLAALWLHLAEVQQHVLASDRPSDPWLVLPGMAGLTEKIVASSVLHNLPAPLAGLLAVLPLLGWAGWKSELGRTAFLLFAGYAIFFMLAGRENNFYWALVVTPAWFVGYAFLPMAVKSLGPGAKRFRKQLGAQAQR
ncbi:hypothetical protein [Paraurantiacibacter namhicola]|uniref:DUF2029 domain-containing protein n=1 Tax=Paraurantiacibacter namhicola TaxID=645517 RepID=A0A1C7DBP3_9SPHN|nr:hypothetical protein [Paraurantiacibacter namhicola]ANU08837.1 hypothetical protein A6F65_02559 [Paraurantiacibacter namhicola]